MSSSRSGRRGERGVTLVFMAISIVMVLGMAALVIDYGMIKSQIAEGQRAVDAAALAGASQYSDTPIPADEPVVSEMALSYAQKHSVGGKLILLGEVNVEPVSADTIVTVTFERSGIKTWFAHVFGTKTMGIKAVAAAKMRLPTGAPNRIPVLIK